MWKTKWMAWLGIGLVAFRVVEAGEGGPIPFSTSTSGLRPLAEMEGPKTVPPPEPVANEPFTPELAFGTGVFSPSLEAGIQRFEGVNGESVLRLPEIQPEPGGAYGWMKSNVFEPVFVPEVVRIRKVAITSSIITAVKRKNPFCLLSPLVFAASF